MCFSPTASFATAGVLSVLGGAAVNKVKNKKQLPIALVPIFFAIQQLAEGLVWITIDNPDYKLITTIAGYIFIYFAFIFWPVYAPYAVGKAEPTKVGIKRIQPFYALGILVSIYLLVQVFRMPPVPEIIDHSIGYQTVIAYGAVVTPLYVIATIGSILLSSHKIIRYYGLALSLALAISMWSYSVTFTSVWCFFAAALSGIAVTAWLRSQAKNKK